MNISKPEKKTDVDSIQLAKHPCAVNENLIEGKYFISNFEVVHTKIYRM